jgi:hypothetical protein
MGGRVVSSPDLLRVIADRMTQGWLEPSSVSLIDCGTPQLTIWDGGDPTAVLAWLDLLGAKPDPREPHAPASGCERFRGQWLGQDVRVYVFAEPLDEAAAS